MIIRKFKKQDADKVCRLVSATFDEFVSPDFTKQGIRKFLEEQTPEKQVRRSKTRDIFVAIADDKVVGVIEGKENNKITRLFVDKKYHGKGIARKLVDRIEKLYRKRGAKKIIVWSSLYAQKFYEKMGYKKSRGMLKKKGFVYQPMRKNPL